MWLPLGYGLTIFFIKQRGDSSGASCYCTQRKSFCKLHLPESENITKNKNKKEIESIKKWEPVVKNVCANCIFLFLLFFLFLQSARNNKYRN